MSKSNAEKYIGKLLEERYQILDIIGEGGMAVVYKALDTRLNRNVAVKIMRDEMAEDIEFKARFAAESHAIAMLSHPNLVAVYDVSHNEDIEFIVMELIDGITLRQYMEKKGKIDWKEVLHFSKQIASGLEHAHTHGIIHRDIKPQNIMLLKDGSIKVADFGIAALENDVMSSEFQGVGSLNYIAPEEAKGELIDSRCDIYSLGVSMYEMICGQKPYMGSTPAEILVKQMSEDITPIREITPNVPEEFAEIINKAMNPDLSVRYRNATEFIEDLNAFTTDFIKADSKTQEVNPVVDNTTVQKKKPSFKSRFRAFKRATRASVSFSAFGMCLAIFMCAVILWRFWLSDIFATAERVILPDFTGSNYTDISNNDQFKSLFNFIPNYVVDTTTSSGTILKQEPAAGRSLMINKTGIDITLDVSTGYILVNVPDVVGLNYREANLLLQNAGFAVELTNVPSDTISKDEVISSSPTAGEQISSGSTVYIYVSGGKEITYIKMPNVVGLTEEAAIYKITNNNLTYYSTQRQNSDYEAGTVIAQSVPAFAEVEERTKIIITVSDGPSNSPLPQEVLGYE